MASQRPNPSSRWKEMTPFLLVCAFLFAWGGVLFGLDTGSFGAIQALPRWLKVFGTNTAQGDYELTTSRKAIMNGVVWPGKLLGTVLFEPLAKRYGYKTTAIITCFIQFVGIIIEISAHEWIQFSIGRIIAYLSVGLIENVVPSYSAEIAPKSCRGLFAGSLMCIVTLGNLWGAGMGQACSEVTTKAGWLIPVGVQFIPAAILLAGLPFTVESPRWLLTQGKHEPAMQSLNRLRPSHQVLDSTTSSEIHEMSSALDSDTGTAEGTWLELFQGTYLRRTIIASLLFWFQQTTGGQFVLTYSPTFFKEMGLGSKSFTYSFIAQIAGFVGALMACLTTDRIGRRPLFISGMFLAALFNFLIAGFGAKQDPSSSEVAIAFATAIDVVAAVVITVSIPYLLGTPGTNLKAGVGWILGGNSIFGLLFAILLVPELKGRSLDEVDELFEARLWAWQFEGYQTSGPTSQVNVNTEKGFEDTAQIEFAETTPRR